VQQAALAWPNVHFRLAHNGLQICEYPRAETTRDRILQVYGNSLVDQMVMVQDELSGLRVHGMVLTATAARASRSPQELFVNRRPIKNTTISHAIYEGYGVSLAKGHHPLYVLFVEVDPARVDVNVHPTKREVRFADPDHVHRAVQRAIRSSVGTAGIEGSYAGIASSQMGGPLNMEHRTVDLRGNSEVPFFLSSLRSPEFERVPADAARDLSGQTVRESSSSYQAQSQVQSWESVIPFGQIQQTFLVAQVGSELQVIDQHTAHERVLFERLLQDASRQTVVQQPLLIPEPVTVPLHQAVHLEQHLAELATLGLDLEPFGTGTFLVRAVPALLGRMDGAALVQGLLEDVTDWSTPRSFEQRMRPILATMACHTAVRAGRLMALPEIKTLIEDWVAEGLPATCPHGRRVALRLPAVELEKIFGR
jgi:DNA mismatch repair protein MutL